MIGKIYNLFEKTITLLNTRLYFLVLKNHGKKIEITRGVRITTPQNVEIMSNVFINNFCLLNGEGGLFVGNNTIIGPYTNIWTSNHVFIEKDILIKNQGHDLKPVYIGDNCWIGSNVVILPGVKIGDGTIIGAGSIVTKDIEAYSVAVGNPAKIIKKRT